MRAASHAYGFGLMAPIALALWIAQAQEPFGQERVETRPFRTEQRIAALRPRAHGSQGPTHRDEVEHEHGDTRHGLESENMFGFTLGSDTDPAGTRVVASEKVVRFGRRGTYRALGQKLELGSGLTDDFNVSISAFGDYHLVRNVPDFDDVHGRYAFNGFGGELRWRVLRRDTGPFGLTLHLEPSISRIDELSGLAGRKLGSENKLIFDRELVPGVLFGAVNLTYDVERVREHNAQATERAAVAGASFALSHQIAPKLFLGAEARYRRAYEGFLLRRYSGDALSIGPTLFAQLSGGAWLSAAWNVQVRGREAVDRRGRASELIETLTANAEAAFAAAEAGEEPPTPALPYLTQRPSRLNLKDFERHQFRLKVGFEF